MKLLCRFCFNALNTATKWICNAFIIALYTAAVLITVPVGFIIALIVSLMDWSAPGNKKSLAAITVHHLKYAVEYYRSALDYKHWQRR